ncbi:MAG: 2-hydroxyacid dehydrogenase [Candidatus Nanopelagicales bacterium]
MTNVTMFDTKKYDRNHLGKALQDAGFEVKFREFRLNPDTVETVGEDVDVVCVFVNDKLTAEVIEQLAAKGVKMIALRCAGFNGVDLQAAADHGILVARVPAYSPYAVAEHAVTLALALNRRIPQANRRVRDMNFTLDGLVGFDMHGKTVGLIGTGKIGRIAGQIFKGFGMRVIMWDPYPDPAWAAEHGLEYVELSEIGREADIVSLHVPLFPETHHILNALVIDALKPGVIIINVSRGALVDTRALIEALKSGHVGGVGLDVYEEEEGKFFEDLSGEVMDDDVLARLLTFPNVLVTAHQAFLTHEALDEIAKVTTENIAAFAAGESPQESRIVLPV